MVLYSASTTPTINKTAQGTIVGAIAILVELIEDLNLLRAAGMFIPYQPTNLTPCCHYVHPAPTN